MITNSMEREVRLCNLLKRLAFRWKRILIGAMCVAVLGCGVKYFRDMSHYGQVTGEELSEAELQHAEEMVRKKQMLEDYEAYLKSSWLIQTNPFAIPVLSMEFRVDAGDSVNESADATAMYVYYVTSGLLAQDIADSGWNNMEEQLLQEVMTCSVNVTGSNVFVIEIKGITEELNEQLSGEIYERLQEYKKREEVLSQVELNQLKIVKSTQADYELYANQLEQNTLIESELSAYESAVNGLSDEQKKYISYSISEPVKQGISVPYMIIFGMMGLLVMVIAEVLGYLFNGKLQESRELEENCGVTFLGIVEEKHMDGEIEKVSENLSSCLKMHGVSKETAMLSVGADDKVIQECIRKLRENSSILSDVGNILDDFSKQEKVLRMGQAILVEREGVSDYQDIVREIQLMLKEEVKILGYIYVR